MRPCLGHAARVIAALGVASVASVASAQDFGSAAPTPQRDAFALLEAALPTSTRWSLTTAATRWWAMPELTTRAVAAQVPLASLRVAAGLSQTGEPAIGWTTAGLALGAVSAHGGGAVRVAVRRDRAPSPSPSGAWGEGLGGEAGAGAWLRPAPQVELWASAPQMFTRGLAPPLARALTCGLHVQSGDLSAWATLAGSRRHAEAAERGIGLMLASGRNQVWLATRDGPWRASGGVSAQVGGMQLACGIETHPSLDETVRLSLAWDR